MRTLPQKALTEGDVTPFLCPWEGSAEGGQARPGAKATMHPAPAASPLPQSEEPADVLGVQGSCCQLPGGVEGAAEPGVPLLGEEQPGLSELHLVERSPAGLFGCKNAFLSTGLTAGGQGAYMFAWQDWTFQVAEFRILLL